MTRNMLIGWALLVALFLGWTQYKGRQAREVQQQRIAQMKLDSVARAERAVKTPAQPVLGAAPETTSAETAAPAAEDSPAPETAERRLITVETPRFTAVLDARGARIAELRVPSIQGKALYNPVLISPQGEGALTLSLNGTSLANTVWTTTAAGDFLRADSAQVSVVFSTTLPGGERVTRTYTFLRGGQVIRHALGAPEGSIASYAIEWKGGLEETDRMIEGKGIGLTASYFSEIVYDNGTNVQRENFEGRKSFNAESGVINWAGMRRKYVAVLLDFGRSVPARIDGVGKADPGKGEDAPHRYEMKIVGGSGETAALNFDIVVMPLRYEAMLASGRNYEQILFTGWEWFLRADVWYVKLCGLVLKLLNVFYSWVPNYGVAIILLTLLVRFITLPLSINQTRQAAKLALHQPEIKKIQERHKGDRQKTQVEIMEYYRQQGINPMAPLLGCFPMLLQMPVFIALFNVLGRAVELHEMPFFAWITDLSRPDVIFEAFKIPFLFPVGLTILPFFMAGTMWWQMKMTIKDPNQKAMIWLMPIMMFVFSCSFPSGLVLYWTVSNLFTIAQTKVFGAVPPPKPIVSRAPAKPAVAAKKKAK
ncbi:MAG: rane protein insertase, YidC/Oxa1 family [Fibrobacteria bacterium]|nr:rane protein insertase, YidC/Oxa1 family [Fibrobacteria bacterium]